MKVYIIECVRVRFDDDGKEMVRPYHSGRTFTTICASSKERAKWQAQLLLHLANQIDNEYRKAYVYTEEGRGWSGIVTLDY